MSRRRRPTGGFALIEVLGALTVFAVALLAHFSLLHAAVRMNGRARRTTAAASVAQDKLEELRIGPRTSGADEVASAGEGPTYLRHWMVGAGPAPGTTELVVTVTWPDGSLTHAVEYTTVVRN